MPSITPLGDEEVTISEQGTLKYSQDVGTATLNHVSAHTVPAGKKWILKAIGLETGGATPTSTSRWEIQDSAGLRLLKYFDTSLQNQANFIDGQSITLTAGWIVYFNSTTGTSQTHKHTVLYTELDA